MQSYYLLADNGDLEHDLQALLIGAGQAAQAGETVLGIFIDELQYVEEPQLAALITAMHACAQHLGTTHAAAQLGQASTDQHNG
ncbi:MAG TPA: hypothetical protein VFP68_12495 [Burkholderiaceae bacterium]|nr:hypothetical protein [Burkholderiaceae bacterium]